MNAAELITELEASGVMIEAAGDRLRVDAPKGAVTLELREALAACKAEVLAILNAPEDEIGWRVEAMLSQIPNVGLSLFWRRNQRKVLSQTAVTLVVIL